MTVELRPALYQAALLEAERIMRERELGLAELRQLVEALEAIAVALGVEDPGISRRYAEAIAAIRALEGVERLLEANLGPGGEL
jgi:hypothetical protein